MQVTIDFRFDEPVDVLAGSFCMYSSGSYIKLVRDSMVDWIPRGQNDGRGRLTGTRWAGKRSRTAEAEGGGVGVGWELMHGAAVHKRLDQIGEFCRGCGS